ncbi:hypothetical protein TNCV_3786561 [Trichonephila clavipes]|nr:hypothetical protein TNCV_3786561 [Trichonephila clavipes]
MSTQISSSSPDRGTKLRDRSSTVLMLIRSVVLINNRFRCVKYSPLSQCKVLLEIATEKKHHPTRAFRDSIVNLRKQVASAKREAVAGQASRRNSGEGRHNCVHEVYESCHL